ncbi:MAG: DUF5694 domain-containing protein, partial [Bryobacteraceae bacterium]
MKTLVVALASIVIGASALAQSGDGPQRPTILLIGVAHFASTADVFNTKKRDVQSAEMQKQIGEVIDALKAFRPTKVALEIPFGSETESKNFEKYLAGEWKLSDNERQQLGFRLAKEAGLKRIYPIDHREVPWDFDAMAAWAKKNGQQSQVDAIMEWGKINTERTDKMSAEKPLIELLRYLNSPEGLRNRQSVEMKMAQIGAGVEYPGADVVSNWFKRNLRIYANLRRILDSQGDRVVVIFGQGHMPILRELIADSDELVLSDPLAVL